jgi:CRP-like cAMP-binding protein
LLGPQNSLFWNLPFCLHAGSRLADQLWKEEIYQKRITAMTTVDKLLAQSPVFETLTDIQRKDLMDMSIQRSFRRDAVIAFAGDVWPYLFFIASGSINALKESVEGRSLIVTTFTTGDIFWGLAFFHEEMCMPVTLHACEETCIYLWSHERLLPFLLSEGRFSWELSRLMIHKMARASQILEEMVFQPVAGRLAKLLIDLARDEPQGAVTRSLTLDEMAARIGSTREMVCRFLHRFADEGLIDISRTEYSITDPRRLSGVAQSSKG